MSRVVHVMRGVAAAVVLFAAPLTPAQEPTAVTVTQISRIDGGLAAVLEFADVKDQWFHIEARARRARLVAGRTPNEAGARELTIGSAEEAKVLRALEAWCTATFSREEQQELLAPENLRPRRGKQDAGPAVRRGARHRRARQRP